MIGIASNLYIALGNIDKINILGNINIKNINSSNPWPWDVFQFICLLNFCAFFYFVEPLIYSCIFKKISFSCLFVFFCSSLSIFKMIIFNILLKYFIKQFMNLHFFRVSYWTFISFFWWCYVCLTVYDSCSLALESMNLKEKSFLLVFQIGFNR